MSQYWLEAQSVLVLHWHSPSLLQLPEAHSPSLMHDAPNARVPLCPHLPKGLPQQVNGGAHIESRKQDSSCCLLSSQVFSPMPITSPLSQYLLVPQSASSMHRGLSGFPGPVCRP